MIEFLFVVLGGFYLYTIFSGLQLKKFVKKVKESDLSKIDLMKEKDKAYYRDILKGYSPAELSYIDDFEVNGKKEAIATLLSLKFKKAIDILDNKIVITDYLISELKSTELFILEHINNGIVQLDYNSFKKQIIQEAIEDKIVENNPLFNENVKKIIIFIFLYIAFYFLFSNLNTINNEKVYVIVVTVIFIIFGIISKILSPDVAIVKLVTKSNLFRRTQKGEEINVKIEGLRKYIKDYSLLNKSDKEALSVWEEYLIYSVLFDEDSNVILNDMSDLVNIV